LVENTDMADRRGWLVVVAYAAVAGATQMLWLTFAPITTGSAAHYQVSVDAIGWLAQVFPLVYVVLAIPAGVLLDRWFRPVLAAGALLAAAGGAARLIGDSFTWALLGQVLVAVAQPLVLNAVTKLASEYLPEASRPAGIAAGSAGIFVGMLVALLMGPLMSGSFTGLLLAQAAAAVVAAAALVALLRRPGPAAAVVENLGLSAIRKVLGDPFIRVLAALVFVGFGAFIGLITWLQALLAPAGVSDVAAGGLLIAMVVAGVIGSAILPALVARRGWERLMIGASVVVAGVGCVVLGFVPLVAVDAIVLVLIGALLLADLPVVLELTERQAGAAGGSAAALMWLSGNLGGLVVALAVQALIGRPLLAFLAMAAITALGLPLVLFAYPSGWALVSSQGRTTVVPPRAT
jgi:predicted MFS family arabinose efflux permease